MKNKIILILVFLVEASTFKVWFACKNFNDIFHFSLFDNKIKLEEAIGNDKGQPFLITHFLYNKVTYTPEQIFEKYLLFGDIRFGVLFFSIVGYFGIVCGFWYFFTSKKKNKYLLLSIVLLLLLPFLAIFKSPMPYALQVILIGVPYILFSLFGIWQFLHHKKRLAIPLLIILCVLSLWYIAVLQKDIFTYFCYN